VSCRQGVGKAHGMRRNFKSWRLAPGSHVIMIVGHVTLNSLLTNHVAPSSNSVLRVTAKASLTTQTTRAIWSLTLPGGQKSSADRRKFANR